MQCFNLKLFLRLQRFSCDYLDNSGLQSIFVSIIISFRKHTSNVSEYKAIQMTVDSKLMKQAVKLNPSDASKPQVYCVCKMTLEKNLTKKIRCHLSDSHCSIEYSDCSFSDRYNFLFALYIMFHIIIFVLYKIKQKMKQTYYHL